jgi:ubiquinone/menaquinone biosynthesis C-methylase UbiE
MRSPDGAHVSRRHGWASYERRLVPRLVAPFADDIATAVAGEFPGRFVLDLAAGTGATGESVAAAHPDAVTVALDLDADALAVGQALGRNKGRAVSADAQRLPLRDRSVAAVVCQQGLQFVPDLDVVNKEVARVLQPDGRLVTLTWAALEDVCVFAALSDLADGMGVGPAFGDPCSLAPQELADSIVGAGLVVISQRRITKTLATMEERTVLSDFLAHWVVAADDVLVEPWRAADFETRERWVSQFGAALTRGSQRLTAVLTVARR